MTGGTLTVSGGTYTFNLLTDFDQSSVHALNGASVTFTALTSYSNSGAASPISRLTSTGSTLDLLSLASLGSSTVA